jgi:hypothetical protein
VDGSCSTLISHDDRCTYVWRPLTTNIVPSCVEENRCVLISWKIVVEFALSLDRKSFLERPRSSKAIFVTKILRQSVQLCCNGPHSHHDSSLATAILLEFDRCCLLIITLQNSGSLALRRNKNSKQVAWEHRTCKQDDHHCWQRGSHRHSSISSILFLHMMMLVCWLPERFIGLPRLSLKLWNIFSKVKWVHNEYELRTAAGQVFHCYYLD